MIRESSKRQNAHSTTSYFLLCFLFLDSYCFWQRIIEKYSSRYLKCNETCIINRIFYLANSVVSESTFQGAWGKRVRQTAGHHVCSARGLKDHPALFFFRFIIYFNFNFLWLPNIFSFYKIIYRNSWPKSLLW